MIETQKQHTLLRNKELVGRTELVLVEKESKRSSDQWAGRTDSNKLVIFDKGDVQVKDLVPVRIKDARGISLHGEIIQIQEMEGA